MGKSGKVRLSRGKQITLVHCNHTVADALQRGDMECQKQDLAALEGAHFIMIRSMMNVGDELHGTKQELLQKFDLPRLADYITQERM